MTIYTIGFTQKSAETFFSLLKANHIDLLLDIRLNNKSQLAGFSKGDDLRYFLREIVGADYIYAENAAPTKELMDGVKSKKIARSDFDAQFQALMTHRQVVEQFAEAYGNHQNICLLCSEVSAADCHRGVLANLLAERYGYPVVHL